METQSEVLADRIHSLAIRLLRQVRAAESGSHLSALRLSTLSVLVDQGPRSVGQLAAEEQVSAPTMSRQVTALERAGYVAWQEDDGRDRVRITPEGVAALEEARTLRVDRLVALLDGVDEDRKDALLESTEILEEVLQQPVG